MPGCCSRVPSIDPPINDAVECHRGRASEHHAEQNSQQMLPLKGTVGLMPGDDGRQQGEWKCKNGMTESDQFKKVTQLTKHRFWLKVALTRQSPNEVLYDSGSGIQQASDSSILFDGIDSMHRRSPKFSVAKLTRCFRKLRQ